ncbi:hypothetical protein [Sphingomonas sp. LR55]|uniref:hypothetical protein n=1 Tax=Sphingomonas sp. LR55 TaxID=3050231 RepID=UPI002FE42970
MTAALQQHGIDQGTEQAGEPETPSQTAPDHPAPLQADPAPQTANAPRAYIPATPTRYTQRSDGWTPDRQRGFLERIAEGATVDEASASVGLSPGAAYTLRRRAAGAAFALGWDAAKLVARPIVAETLFLRAIAGQTERVTRPDGDVIERHRYDNRLAMSLLNRLDRHADATETANAATRMVAAEFDAFLDIIARDAGPARRPVPRRTSRRRRHTGGGGARNGISPERSRSGDGADPRAGPRGPLVAQRRRRRCRNRRHRSRSRRAPAGPPRNGRAPKPPDCCNWRRNPRPNRHPIRCSIRT